MELIDLIFWGYFGVGIVVALVGSIATGESLGVFGLIFMAIFWPIFLIITLFSTSKDEKKASNLTKNKTTYEATRFDSGYGDKEISDLLCQVYSEIEESEGSPSKSLLLVIQNLAKKSMDEELSESNRKKLIKILKHGLKHLDEVYKYDPVRHQRRSAYEKALENLGVTPDASKNNESNREKQNLEQKNNSEKKDMGINKQKNQVVGEKAVDIEDSSRKNIPKESVLGQNQKPTDKSKKTKNKNNISEDLESLQFCATLVAMSDGYLSPEEESKIGEIRIAARQIINYKLAINEYGKTGNLEKSLKKKPLDSIVNISEDILLYEMTILNKVKESYFEAVQKNTLIHLIRTYADRIKDPFIQKITAWACLEVAESDGEFDEDEEEVFSILLNHWGLSSTEVYLWIYRVLYPVLTEKEPDEETSGHLLTKLLRVSNIEEILSALGFHVEDDKKDDRVVDENPVWDAIIKGTFDDLVKMKMTKKQINEAREQGDIKGVMPIMVIANHGTTEQLEALINSGADVMAKAADSEENYSVLMLAVKSNDASKVKVLLDAGADVNAIKPGESLYSALGIAAIQGNKEIVRMLLQAGADINWRDNHGTDIVKRVAMETEDSIAAEMIELLVESGLTTDNNDNEGFFPIHNAASEGKVNVIRVLVKYGADPNQPVLDGEEKGTLPLKNVIRAGSYEGFTALIDIGADIKRFQTISRPFNTITITEELDGNEVCDLLEILLMNEIWRTNGNYPKKDTIQIAKDLVNKYGFKPTLLPLLYSTFFKSGNDLTNLLFKASKDEIIKYCEPTHGLLFLEQCVATASLFELEFDEDKIENIKNIFEYDLEYKDNIFYELLENFELKRKNIENIEIYDDEDLESDDTSLGDSMSIEKAIHHFNLEDWWNSDFTKDERKLLIDNTKEYDVSSITPSKLLKDYLTYDLDWNFTKNNREICEKLYRKAEALFGKNDDILDQHFFYDSGIKFYYPDRANEESMKKAIEACRNQIAIGSKTAKKFKKLQSRMPQHRGYQQLSIILDKQNNYADAIKICKQALAEGWAGDWDVRIARYEKKLKS